VPSPRYVAKRSRWPYLSLIPLGLGAWAPIYAGTKVHRKLWVLLGVLWCACVVAGFISDATRGQAGHDDLAGGLFIIGWAGAIATSFSVRSTYEQALASPLEAAAQRSLAELADRRRARQIARENPELARQMGIGRPDVPGATDEGLVDVNNASVTALLGLPGMTGDVAAEIIEARDKVNGFQSCEDMGSALDLDGHLVEGLRDHVVFLPRS
jgi:DNA uptake protein ComE-like DNA-binding protein